MLIMLSVLLQEVVTAGKNPEVPLCVAIPVAIIVMILYSRAGLRGWTGKH